MTIEPIRSLRRARPFRPFRIWLVDGRKFDVSAPEFLADSPAGRTIAVANPDDTLEFVDVSLVTCIEVAGRRSRRQHRR